MDLFSGDFSTLVFKRSITEDLNEICLDGQSLQVLIELDGTKNLAAINKALNISHEKLKKIITELYQLNLIVKNEQSSSFSGREFFDYLKTQLSLAMGPIAEFIIEDEIKELGNDATTLSYQHAAELVDLLSRQIHREEKKVAFQQAMVKRIKELKT